MTARTPRTAPAPRFAWLVAGWLVAALGASTPAFAGFGAGGSDSCPPECMCTGLDCPEVHADCSGCDSGTGGGTGGGGDDSCVEKEPDSCDVPSDDGQSGGSGPVRYCDDAFEVTSCALTYFYLLAACAGEAPIPDPDDLLDGTIVGDVEDAVEEVEKYLEGFSKKKFTLDDITLSPGVAKVVDGVKCGACVAAVDAWAYAACPDAPGRGPWRSNTADICVEAVVGGEGEPGLYTWHKETINALIECEQQP